MSARVGIEISLPEKKKQNLQIDREMSNETIEIARRPRFERNEEKIIVQGLPAKASLSRRD